MIIQPCDRRVFTNREYREAGALVQDDLSEAGLVLGIFFYGLSNIPRKVLNN